MPTMQIPASGTRTGEAEEGCIQGDKKAQRIEEVTDFNRQFFLDFQVLCLLKKKNIYNNNNNNSPQCMSVCLLACSPSPVHNAGVWQFTEKKPPLKTLKVGIPSKHVHVCPQWVAVGELGPVRAGQTHTYPMWAPSGCAHTGPTTVLALGAPMWNQGPTALSPFGPPRGKPTACCPQNSQVGPWGYYGQPKTK